MDSHYDDLLGHGYVVPCSYTCKAEFEYAKLLNREFDVFMQLGFHRIHDRSCVDCCY